MDVARMRVEISKAYSGKKWQDKVKKMKDGQVIAVYYHFLNKQNARLIEEHLLDIPLQPTVNDIFARSRIAVSAKTNGNCIVMPHEDTILFGNTICSKEALVAGWTELIGKYVEIGNGMQRVHGVRIEDDHIFIDLESQ